MNVALLDESRSTLPGIDTAAVQQCRQPAEMYSNPCTFPTTSVCVYIYICIYICTYMCMYVYIFVHIYVYIYVYIYIFIYEYRHICTQRQCQCLLVLLIAKSC